MSGEERPSVFIGSSEEGLGFARAIRDDLEDDVEATVWNEDFFTTGGTTIETLISAAPKFDFAILVLTPDDFVKSRNSVAWGPRDNVIFELGLFMGRLGRERTFAVYQKNGRVKIPSDLAGVSFAGYRWPNKIGSYAQAVGYACNLIRTQIKRLSPEILTGQIQQFAKEQRRQEGDINMIKLMLRLILPEYERVHLGGLASADKSYPVIVQRGNSTFESELRHLLNLKLVERQGERRLRHLFENDGEYDLKEWLKITSWGREYLAAYEKIQEDHATETSSPPDSEAATTRRKKGRGRRKNKRGRALLEQRHVVEHAGRRV
jgi:hypothetical protein